MILPTWIVFISDAAMSKTSKSFGELIYGGGSVAVAGGGGSGDLGKLNPTGKVRIWCKSLPDGKLKGWTPVVVGAVVGGGRGASGKFGATGRVRVWCKSLPDGKLKGWTSVAVVGAGGGGGGGRVEELVFGTFASNEGPSPVKVGFAPLRPPVTVRKVV